MLLPLFHLSVLSLNVYALWYDQKYLDLPLPAKGYYDMPFKGRLMFLTIWCLILQTVYFFLSLLNDLFGSSEPSPRQKPLIRLLKDTLFGLAFALAVLVGSSFWGIYHIDKELIFPEVIARLYPPWLNHTMHSFIVLFIFIELVFTNKAYPPRKVYLTLAITFYAAYLVWLHILFERTGAWVYPIFKVLNLPSRIVYFALTTSLGLGLYILGDELNSFARPSPKKQVEGKKKR